MRQYDMKVKNGDFPIPVTKEEINDARNGIFNIKLTPEKNVPKDWFPKDLRSKKILCLASSGSKEIHLLAATGALVTVFDISHHQLKKDEQVAKAYNFMLSTVEGHINNLNIFKDNFFDMIFCPTSITYTPEIVAVFEECYRVLKSGGSFLFGTINPLTHETETNLTLGNIIGGQTSVGFIIDNFYEDTSKYFATSAKK